MNITPMVLLFITFILAIKYKILWIVVMMIAVWILYKNPGKGFAKAKNSKGKPIQASPDDKYTYRYNGVPVAGTHKLDDRQPIMEAQLGDKVELIFNQDDGFQSEVIRVHDIFGRMLGYVARSADIESKIISYKDQGFQIESYIDAKNADRITLKILFVKS